VVPEHLRNDGRRRVVIEGVAPEIDGGAFPAKRAAGEDVVVEADVFCDGHDVLACELRFRRADDRAWQDATMELVENDRWLRRFASALREGDADAALDDELLELMRRHPDRADAVTYERELEVLVDPERARFSAWYELFPRSTAKEPGRHGTFKDVEARLPYV